MLEFSLAFDPAYLPTHGARVAHREPLRNPIGADRRAPFQDGGQQRLARVAFAQSLEFSGRERQSQVRRELPHDACGVLFAVIPFRAIRLAPLSGIHALGFFDQIEQAIAESFLAQSKRSTEGH